MFRTTDLREILTLEENEGPPKAMIRLLSLTATKSIDWFPKFIYSLEQHGGYKYISDEILNKLGKCFEDMLILTCYSCCFMVIFYSLLNGRCLYIIV